MSRCTLYIALHLQSSAPYVSKKKKKKVEHSFTTFGSFFKYRITGHRCFVVSTCQLTKYYICDIHVYSRLHLYCCCCLFCSCPSWVPAHLSSSWPPHAVKTSPLSLLLPAGGSPPTDSSSSSPSSSQPPSRWSSSSRLHPRSSVLSPRLQTS